jgi:hypothetical protein
MRARSSDQRLLFWPACVQGWACEGLGTWAGLWVNIGFRIVTQHVLWAAMDGSKKREFVIFGFSFLPRPPDSMLKPDAAGRKIKISMDTPKAMDESQH